MKPLIIPKNKFLRLLINVVLIVCWFIFYCYVIWFIQREIIWFLGLNPFDNSSDIIGYILLFIPMFFITRYIWFEKSRNKIFYGLFNNFKKFEPRIYTTTSNADELKKYAELKDKGIITEEEFKSKKKKLLDL